MYPRRYLQPISKDTAYFEVDEIKDSKSKRRCIRLTDRFNILSDIKISDMENQTRDKCNLTSDDYAQVYLSFLFL